MSLSSYRLTSDGSPGCLVITVMGELDLLTRDQLHHSGADLLRAAGALRESAHGRAQPSAPTGAIRSTAHTPQNDDLIVDLSYVPFVDCAGLGGLLSLLGVATGAGFRVALVASQRSVVFVLCLAGVEEVCPLVPDIASAQHLLQRAPGA